MASSTAQWLSSSLAVFLKNTRRTEIQPRDFFLLCRESSCRILPISHSRTINRYNKSTDSHSLSQRRSISSTTSRPWPTRSNPVLHSQPNNSPQPTTTTTTAAVAAGAEEGAADLHSKPIAQLTSTVRTLMRHVPHPVAIITSTDPSIPSKDQPASTWRGATVSSFNTVTLDPEPIVSFNIKRLSSTFDAITHSGLFNVHLLNSDQEAIRVATRFASGNAREPFFDEHGSVEGFVETGCESIEPPIIRTGGQHDSLNDDNGGGSGTAVAFGFRCRYLRDKTVVVGDHAVVLGLVTRIFHGRGNLDFEGLDEHRESCLVYANRRYGTVKM